MTPIYTTVLANPDPVQWTANGDGRYIGIGSPTERLDAAPTLDHRRAALAER